ncbi:threonine--tRNA ligase [Pyruvatibacter mobilis]|uniref:Threonine--tRNA ligase n=1 Tax=Pyruvatibacter mobilis TaxID=1712261 RepID=A0A845QE77_9HYPH|nr:threonine--tRNA ligase [Pyruvatibacter mobilis]NBG96862.1 threonine--tRNA ligase [Pyruvatibacter mobilis]QJD74757.1 threonine--tRNA ligase [Pyruvatibacter mobilis]GGD09876.1 threonine--tRNA ligase [Pyruvatibacter mobilis]
MVKLTLPDESIREFPEGITGLGLAEDISKSLAKKVVAIEVNGDQWDLTREIEQDAKVRLITRDEPEGVEIIRHDTAHVLAEAVQELFPGTQVTIGPNIENGFFYDFARDEPFSTDDFEKIERRMAEIVDRDEPITREVWDRNEAIEHFKSIGESYKAEIISDLPENETITVYRQGNWKDLCRGPHLPSTGRLGKAFKLTKLAGAYWRGDSNNAQLQRIYGTAWASEKDLKKHLQMLEEAEKRDHRKLGREMNLFHFQEEGPGSIFWHPHGWTLFQSLISYMRDQQAKAGYEEINTPDVMDKSLWEKSGHWEKFGENMYTSVTPDERTFCLKPMNCPGHVQVFKHGLKSYRELPLKFAEFGKVHRYEPSGALHGMMRVRHFTQDDAHIFCTEDQITEECVTVTNLILSIYRDFGFEDVRLKFSDRPEKRVGSDAIWDRAEAALKTAIEATGLEYELNPGEGAFYGPKIEFVLRDAIGRDWQCGTVQVDFNLPGRLGAFYIGEDGEKHEPVMIHRALFGSLERFLGILIEHHAGRFPLWLAPLQCVVATITSDADDYAHQVVEELKRFGLKAEADIRNEKINYKVREHSLAKVPALLVVGKREAEERTVAIRRLGSKDQIVLPLAEAAQSLAEEALPPQAQRVQAAAAE